MCLPVIKYFSQLKHYISIIYPREFISVKGVKQSNERRKTFVLSRTYKFLGVSNIFQGLFTKIHENSNTFIRSE